MDLLRLNQWAFRKSELFQDGRYALPSPKWREDLSDDRMAQDEAYRTFVAFILGRNDKLTVIAQRRFTNGLTQTIPEKILERDRLCYLHECVLQIEPMDK